ncbi:unnamed protein product [Moneuplotes crassus]|uniref:Uncharacterized protein n=1 Tax=Euplotes crassus TaxID=5936 RepID=A0AAD1XB28_EUPCR|nr:unnamed protein product [Moneuplotes crassus]
METKESKNNCDKKFETSPRYQGLLDGRKMKGIKKNTERRSEYNKNESVIKMFNIPQTQVYKKLSNYCSTARQNSLSQSRIKSVYKIGRVRNPQTKRAKESDKRSKIKLSGISKKTESKTKKSKIHVKASEHTRSQYIHQIESTQHHTVNNRSREEHRKRRSMKNTHRNQLFRNIRNEVGQKPNFQVKIIEMNKSKNHALNPVKVTPGEVMIEMVDEHKNESKIPKIKKGMIHRMNEDSLDKSDNGKGSIVSLDSKPRRSGSVSKLKQPTEVHTQCKMNSFLTKDKNKENIELKLRSMSNSDLFSPVNAREQLYDQPYNETDRASKKQGLSSRDSSMSKSGVRARKPPTVPRPFRLSASNSRKKEDTTPQGSEDRNPHYKSFKAKKVPHSHRVPFMVLHSAKNLTQPEKFTLKTDQRSVSKNRSSSNKNNDSEEEGYESKFTSMNLSKVVATTSKNKDSSNFGDLDIDELIKLAESSEDLKMTTSQGKED